MKKTSMAKLTKETRETRKRRVSCGVKFRAAVFKSKKKRLQEKIIDYEENL